MECKYNNNENPSAYTCYEYISCIFCGSNGGQFQSEAGMSI